MMGLTVCITAGKRDTSLSFIIDIVEIEFVLVATLVSFDKWLYLCFIEEETS